MEYLPQAGVNIVTLNVFNWAMIQPDETHYDFSGLDETVRMVTEKGMKICMATATGSTSCMDGTPSSGYSENRI
jgi:beta-galactosidase